MEDGGRGTRSGGKTQRERRRNPRTGRDGTGEPERGGKGESSSSSSRRGMCLCGTDVVHALHGAVRLQPEKSYLSILGVRKNSMILDILDIHSFIRHPFTFIHVRGPRGVTTTAAAAAPPPRALLAGRPRTPESRAPTSTLRFTALARRDCSRSAFVAAFFVRCALLFWPPNPPKIDDVWIASRLVILSFEDPAAAAAAAGGQHLACCSPPPARAHAQRRTDLRMPSVRT